MTESFNMAVTTKMSRNYAIDFWRLIFSVIIVILHSVFFLPKGDAPLMGGGYLAVEFFAILSGYFMMIKIDKRNSSPEKAGEQALLFSLRKYKLSFPLIFLSCGIYYIVFLFQNHFTVKKIIGVMTYSISEFFQIQMSGVYYEGFINKPLWYVSAMLLGGLLLSYLAIKHCDFFKNIFIILFPLFVYGYIIMTYGQIDVWTKFHFILIGVPRVMAGMCIGAVCYNVVKKVETSDFEFTRLGKLLLTLTEFFLYIGVITAFQLAPRSKMDFPLILLLAAACTITLSQRSNSPGIFKYKIFRYCGGLSSALFFGHWMIMKFYQGGLLARYAYPIRCVIYLVHSVIYAVFLLCCMALFQKLHLWEKAKKLLLRPKEKAV